MRGAQFRIPVHPMNRRSFLDRILEQVTIVRPEVCTETAQRRAQSLAQRDQVCEDACFK